MTQSSARATIRRMSSVPTLDGITSRFIDTPRLRVHALFSGKDDGEPVVFVHGNASSATFWEETMRALPRRYRGIALDLRGYGDTEDLLVDATRGLGDWVDDVTALVQQLGLGSMHLVGHSLGGAVLFGLLPALRESVRSLTFVATCSPWGFGGTKDLDGTPTFADFAGSGGGLVNPDFARLMGEKNRGSEHPMASPRVVMNTFYWKLPFRPAREEDLLSSLLTEKVGPQKYPGDATPSPNWPGTAPGAFGPLNATSAKYMRAVPERFVTASHKPPVLWVRGADDQIVADGSMFEIGFLGKLGAVPGWPGDDVFPPQPMLGQTRAVFDRYAASGGTYREVVLPDCAHTPFVEKPEAFNEAFHAHLESSR